MGLKLTLKSQTAGDDGVVWTTRWRTGSPQNAQQAGNTMRCRRALQLSTFDDCRSSVSQHNILLQPGGTCSCSESVVTAPWATFGRTAASCCPYTQPC